jgi:hypothetical protein
MSLLHQHKELLQDDVTLRPVSFKAVKRRCVTGNPSDFQTSIHDISTANSTSAFFGHKKVD